MYPLKTAFSSLGRNAMMTIASVITISCCLFLFGVFLLVTFNINYISDQISEKCELQAFISEWSSSVGEERILKEISALPNVDSAEFESKEDAFRNAREMSEEMAEALDNMDGEQIFRASVKVTLKDLALADETAAQMAAVKGVAKVNNRRDIILKVVSVTNVIRIGSFIAMLILLLTAIFIIRNTIELSVLSREEEIHIMKFVGATDGFIRGPFVIEGVTVGVIGAMVAIIIIAFGYSALTAQADGMREVAALYSFSEVAIPLVAGVLLLGIIMGGIGSRAAVKRHLKV
ncbi:MAG: ABC transporter permease [Oscillospiraceae bacterium]|nr:ABC transporter permease [Oscillospiraceae bacterium]